MPDGSWKCCDCSQTNNSELCGTDEKGNMKCTNGCGHARCENCSDP
ncbi:uncharacterized protein CTRU02_207636 [Colletotrichum truncatum]|uniref:Uncharacterized protein n=1 Tax=Colletotrichum truncatum TaxID=5467 RepID=A0ACC3Z1M7_COLTU|nr:uncharacterized protein CTRU02_09262 [Colletotrichum truncatum]KAF6788941.1 hypothetical protein CTRU02_09262 [Colletotrichum truncatum]